MLSQSERTDEDRREIPGRESVSAALSICGSMLEAQLGRKAEAKELRETVGTFTRVALRHDVPPERTLAVFKTMAARLKPVESLNVVERGVVVHELVQFAIETYYESQIDTKVR